MWIIFSFIMLLALAFRLRCICWLETHLKQVRLLYIKLELSMSLASRICSEKRSLRKKAHWWGGFGSLHHLSGLSNRIFQWRFPIALVTVKLYFRTFLEKWWDSEFIQYFCISSMTATRSILGVRLADSQSMHLYLSAGVYPPQKSEN